MLMLGIEITTWATLLAVVVALFFGTVSLVQTKNIQAKTRNNLMLKELIDWAIAIMECGRGIFLTDLHNMYEYVEHDESIYRITKRYYLELEGEFSVISCKMEYIQLIAKRLDSQMEQKVKETGKCLEQYIENLKSRTATDESHEELDNSARKIIKEAIRLLR